MVVKAGRRESVYVIDLRPESNQEAAEWTADLMRQAGIRAGTIQLVTDRILNLQPPTHRLDPLGPGRSWRPATPTVPQVGGRGQYAR